MCHKENLSMIETAINPWDADWHMDTAVMNQTIWAVQDFILDGINKGHTVTLNKRAITQIQKDQKVGIKVLTDFLGSSWKRRIETALELRKQ